ncbi:proteasome regulatory particle base subunit rpn10 [Malassezia caprae]|uniref:Proteasome regulatory particle base subunit rpn10 n=1 Tax=Malassezia caprae TaxID=1381934 RepID=A0AAF0E7K9_9BASI|nr:proteasome regulatory particle base subunit rpn10 [Malassezia caprae]
MPLEATMLVRWDAQADAVQVLFDAKTSSHPENMVGVMTMAGKSPEVLATLTQDIGKVFAALHSSKLSGAAHLLTGINVAQLALKHRQNKNQRQRVVAFVGSPVDDTEESLEQLAKKLKKNNVAVDIVCFGEYEENHTKLAKFVETVNSNDNSHILVVPPNERPLSDTLLSSPLVMDSDAGAGPSGSANADSNQDFEFGVDPNADPELAMALRLSMEEEQARQQAAQSSQGGDNTTEEQAMHEDHPLAPEDRQPAEGATGSLVPVDAPPLTGTASLDTDMTRQAESEDALLQQALALSKGEAPADEDVSMKESEQEPRATVAGANDGDDDEEMTEQQAIARAIEMSLKDSEGSQQ